MRIQDVFDSARDEEKEAILQRHQELMKEMREKKHVQKVRSKVDDDTMKSAYGGKREKEPDEYLESVERIRAAAIAARISRGEDIARAQEDFLNAKYPDMLLSAKLVNNKIHNLMKQIKKISSRQEGEEFLQKVDPNLLSMPHGEGDSTVFDKAVELLKEKKEK